MLSLRVQQHAVEIPKAERHRLVGQKAVQLQVQARRKGKAVGPMDLAIAPVMEMEARQTGQVLACRLPGALFQPWGGR
ncbi:MAG: hypothetical protein AAF170_18080 [Bacteroidota bacterium]